MDSEQNGYCFFLDQYILYLLHAFQINILLQDVQDKSGRLLTDLMMVLGCDKSNGFVVRKKRSY